MGFSWRALKSTFHILFLHSPASRQVITVVYWKITPSEAQVGEKTQYIYDTLNNSFELKQTVALEITVLSWFNQDFNSNMILWFNFMHMSLACPRGRPPRPTRGICRGIQGDRLDSLPLGRGKFTTLF